MSEATATAARGSWGAGDLAGPWSVADLDRLPDEGRRVEILDGSLLVSPPPAVGHQGIAHRLASLLDRSCGEEWEALEGPGLLLRGEPAPRLVVPDVAVLRREAVWSGASTVRPADVLLVVEIVSPSSQVMDRVTRPALYAEAGIPAYWRVEPDDPDGLSVVVSRLVGDAYAESATVRAGQGLRVGWPLVCDLVPADLSGRAP